MQIEVKKLELSKKGSWYQRNISTTRFRRTMLFIVLGAVAGFSLHYFTEGQEMVAYTFRDSLNSMFMGAFLGWWATNSPCARGRC